MIANGENALNIAMAIQAQLSESVSVGRRRNYLLPISRRIWVNQLFIDFSRPNIYVFKIYCLHNQITYFVEASNIYSTVQTENVDFFFAKL